MTVIRLPSWDELLAPSAPWAVVLEFGGGGLWLLRGSAEAVEGLETRIVAASACRTAPALFDEWATALDFPEHVGRNWEAFDETMSDLEWLPGSAYAVLVADAQRLLADERGRLPTLLEILREAAARLTREGRTLRVVFQSRFDEFPERRSVFREFGAKDVG